jgi:hypothetical protein
MVRRPRFCTHKYRSHGWEQERVPANVSAGIEVESHWAFAPSHCAGTCDEDVAFCYCPTGTKYGREPADPDAPQGKHISFHFIFL